MIKDTIEILTAFDSTEPVQRMKLDALVNLKKHDFDFRRFGEGGEQTAGVLVNSSDIDLSKNPMLHEALQRRAKNAVIMLFIADLHPHWMKLLPAWSTVVDMFLAPTPEMRNFLSAFTERQVEVLLDPVDFCLNGSATPPISHDGPLKVVWFGHPESYTKSMAGFEKDLMPMHQSQEIEYHIVTKNDRYGPMPACIIHEYLPHQFLSLLGAFDVCIVSHIPFDFSVNTLWESEIKALLAINRGLPCVASRTPAYERLLTRCGLQDYLFSSGAELISSLRRLKTWDERSRFLDKSQNIVLENYSAIKMADDWHKLYQKAHEPKLPISR